MSCTKSGSRPAGFPPVFAHPHFDPGRRVVRHRLHDVVPHLLNPADTSPAMLQHLDRPNLHGDPCPPLAPPRRPRRRTAAVTPKDDALVVTRDYGAGQRTPARAASRHSRRKGNNSDKSDHTFVPASDSDKEHRAVQATVQGWIHKEPTALTAEEENTLMREAATEEVMDIGCETTAPPAGTQSFSPQQLDCILALCKGQAVPEEQRQTLAGVLRDIRHTEVQRTLMDAISGASPIIARYLDDAEKEAAQRIAAAPK